MLSLQDGHPGGEHLELGDHGGDDGLVHLDLRILVGLGALAGRHRVLGGQNRVRPGLADALGGLGGGRGHFVLLVLNIYNVFDHYIGPQGGRRRAGGE